MNPDDPPSSPIGSALCTDCGLCCLGALHDSAQLDPDEIETAKTIGLPVLPSERPLFSLPCPKLVNRKCSIYGQRPRVCARYKCALLQQVEAGETTLAQASQRVTTALSLYDAAMTAVRADDGFATIRYQARDDQPIDAADPRAARLRLMALDVYLDRHFRNDKDFKIYGLDDDEPVSVKV